MEFCNNSESKVYIIAEVGQNHQGDLDTALRYIEIFSQAGANAIKFQVRSNKYLFHNDAYDNIYNSENSFGKTYGEHREALELKLEWLPIIKNKCREYKVDFMATAFDEISLENLCNAKVDALKIASFDIGNLSFIQKIAQKNLPIFLSIGGGKEDQISDSIELLLRYNKNINVLHCVSEYPCPAENLNLTNIKILMKKFPNCKVGLSDHFSGILSGPLAYMLGARVFEKHVTLNRSLKGSDHHFSLEQEGFRKFVRDIKRVPLMLQKTDNSKLGKEKVFERLGKSIVASKKLYKGDTVKINDLTGKIFLKQIIPIRESNNIIGKKLKRDVTEGKPINMSDLIE